MKPNPSARVIALAVIMVSFLALPSLAAPRVVVSIKPLHSLVAAVMRGAGTPSLIVEGAASPHNYSLRPSQARLLQEADVVFWIGQDLEAFLEKPLQTLAPDAVSVELGETPGMFTLPMREGGSFEPDTDDDHGHGHDGHDQEGHDHQGHDPHTWLDPENAKLFVKRIADTLAEIDPANETLYQGNASAEIEQIDKLISATARALEPVKGSRFIVFHDAYHYFENRFGLEAAGSLTVNPEIMPGAKRLAEIRDQIAHTGADCVFAEPQFKPALIGVVTEGTAARSGILDPLGADIPEGPELYSSLISNLANSFVDCLKPAL